MTRLLARAAVASGTIALSAALWSTPAGAHRSGCHAAHSCPSDTGSYVCGDTGNYTYCGGGESSGTTDPPPTSPPQTYAPPTTSAPPTTVRAFVATTLPPTTAPRVTTPPTTAPTTTVAPTTLPPTTVAPTTTTTSTTEQVTTTTEEVVEVVPVANTAPLDGEDREGGAGAAVVGLAALGGIGYWSVRRRRQAKT